MTALLERATALETLRARLQGAALRGHVALVSGEAGIGKTSVLRAVADGHAAVWWGRCDALQTPYPLAPLIDIARDARPGFAAQLVAPRPALFDAVLGELRAATTPRLLVIEDAHWADDATLDLLKFIGRRVEGCRALLAISFRDDEVAPGHPLRRVIGELPPAALTRIALPRLTPQAVDTLAQQARREAAGVYDATRGNPFFVTELLRGPAQAVPQSVQDLVLARYARLGRPAQAVVRLASVVPARIERWLLDAVLAPSPDELGATLEAGLLEADGAFLQFRHELARVAVESSLAPPVAQALHAQLLAALVGSGRAVPAARLAHHAAMAEDEQALRCHVPAAAEEARARGSHREAAQHWRSALRLTAADEGDDRRVDWLEALAKCCTVLDRFAEALDARQQLDAVYTRRADARRRALNLSRMALLHVFTMDNARADAANRQAIALLEPLPPGPELATAYGTEGSLRMLNREVVESMAWCARSIEIAHRLGDRERLCASMTTAGVACMFVDHERGVAQVEEALRMAREGGMHPQAANALLNLGSGCGELMRLPDAERWLREAVAFATAHELDGSLHYASAWLALCELRGGRWADAAERASQVLERTGPASISRVMALLALGRVRLLRGDPGVDATLDEAAALARGSGTLQRLAPVAAARAEAAWARGDAAACAAEAGAVLPLAQARGHAWFVGELAYWCWRAGAIEAAPAGSAAPYALEIAGRWREAAAAWQALGCPWEQGRALAVGDAAAQQQALALFDTLGARPAADALRRRLREAGVRGVRRGPRASTRAHPCGLTAAEMQVLLLLGADLRNAEIAARLHRSVRTVDHHVAAVIAKLGASSRLEAVRRAEREGWLAAAAQSGQEPGPR